MLGLKAEGPTKEELIEKTVHAGLFLAGLFVVVSAAKLCNDGACDNFAIAFGTILMLAVMIRFLLKLAGFENHLIVYRIFPLFFFAWAVTGVIILTFLDDALFAAPSTGYFMTWASAGLSSYYLVHEVMLGKDIEVDPIISVLVLTHLSVLIQGAQNCNGDCDGRDVYAIFAAVLGAIYLAGMFWYTHRASNGEQGGNARAMFWMSVGLLMWWTAALIGTTTGVPFFDGFQVLANGFFGVWANFALSAYLAFDYNRRNPDPTLSQPAIVLAFITLSTIIVICQATAGGNAVCLSLEAIGADVEKCKRLEKVAIAMGVISTAITTIAGLFFSLFDEWETNAQFLGYFLIAFWSVGVVFLTFVTEAPFFTANSGYFSTWASLILCIYFVIIQQGTSLPFCCQRGEMSNNFRGILVVFVVAGIILMAAGSALCVLNDGCNAETSFAISAPFITWVFVGLIVALPDFAHIFKIILGLFWLVAVSVLTVFVGPFEQAVVAGNGFYSAWMLFLASVLIQFVPRLDCNRVEQSISNQKSCDMEIQTRR